MESGESGLGPRCLALAAGCFLSAGCSVHMEVMQVYSEVGPSIHLESSNAEARYSVAYVSNDAGLTAVKYLMLEAELISETDAEVQVTITDPCGPGGDIFSLEQEHDYLGSIRECDWHWVQRPCKWNTDETCHVVDQEVFFQLTDGTDVVVEWEPGFYAWDLNWDKYGEDAEFAIEFDEL